MSTRIRTAVIPAGPMVNGEVQLTDSIAATCDTSGVRAIEYDGLRFDCGIFAGLIEANIAVAQRERAPAVARPATPPEACPEAQGEVDREVSAA